MRSSRLLAASSLLALSLGATIGTATAGAAAIQPTPTATATVPVPTVPPVPTLPVPPMPTGTPSHSASPSATVTAGPSTPAPTGTPSSRPTAPLPTAPQPTASGPCPNGHQLVDLKASGTGLAGATLVKGGPAQEMTATIENTSTVDFQKFNAIVFVTDIAESEPVSNPTPWVKDAFTVSVKLPGGDWKNVEGSNPNYLLVDLGNFKLANGAKFTLQVRIAATAKAANARYFAQVAGSSESFPSKSVPGSTATAGCTDFGGSYRVDDLFTVADATAAPSTSAAKATASASPTAGPHLAETGSSSSTLPIAVGGAAVLAAGAGTLFVVRRRKAGTHS